MAVKKCCIEKCKSCSSRKEDQGVTYHKFPKDATVRDTWVRATRHSLNIEIGTFVCSRHFCKNDFKMYQDTKYVLKSGAVPSIFPWTKSKVKTKMDELDAIGVETNEDKNHLSSSSKDSEPENLDAIKKFIESHEKISPASKDVEDQNKPLKSPKTEDKNEATAVEETKENKDEPLVIATSVMNLILSDADNKFKTKKDVKTPSESSSSEKDSTSVSLSVGSKVEARDFADCWHGAEIIEVDYDEMEVLVHYKIESKKYDEWISVNSPRLRPQTGKTAVADNRPKVIATEVKEEEKLDDKPKLMYAVGERCLARWRDNRRFVATIQSDLGNGEYEIMFDDGFQWKCTATRLSKLKDKGKTDPLSDPRATPSPVPGAGPSTGFPVPTQVPIFHTHLFDPTRDYLGSKSERREMKRKLNIKEIFNIGQKQRRKETPPKEDKPKMQKERKKPTILKRNVKGEPKEAKTKTDVKRDIPDAVASIIGTVAKREDDVNIKKEVEALIEPEKETLITNTKIKYGITEEIDKEGKSSAPLIEDEGTQATEAADVRDMEPYIDEDTQSAKLSDDDDLTEQDSKLSDDQTDLFNTDPVVKEEFQLQNFEKPDDEKHVQVIDRIKEAIIKLEDGLNEVQRVESPKTVVKESPKSADLKALVGEEPNFFIKEEWYPLEPKASISTESKILDTEEPKDLKLEEQTSPQPANTEPLIPIEPVPAQVTATEPKTHQRSEKSRKSMSKIKKNKKLRLLQEKRKVKNQVEQVKCELEAMKKQMEEIRKQMLIKTEALAVRQKELPESCLLPEEWCCRWLNGEPLGTVVESESEPRDPDPKNRLALPRRSVKVEDRRLPEGWTKLMVRRSLGNSAGKWDVCLVSPDNKRFHTKTDMRNYLEINPDPTLKLYEHALFDFGVHVKLSRRMGWVKEDGTVKNVSANSPMPFIKRKKLGIKRGSDKKAKRRKLNSQYYIEQGASDQSLMESSGAGDMPLNPSPQSTLEDGYVYVGSLKVQVIDNLLRCPAEGCLKNFRNNTLLQMHIKHYHRELRIMLGATPQVLDLAYARTRPVIMKTKRRYQRDSKIIKVKFPRPPKRVEEPKPEVKDIPEPIGEVVASSRPESEKIPRSLDSPLMRHLATNRPVKRPKVLLPVRRPEPEPDVVDNAPDFGFDDSQLSSDMTIPPMEYLDFETAISAHTVNKTEESHKKVEKRKFTTKAPTSEDEDVMAMNSDLDSQSSFPGSATPDSKTTEPKVFVQNLPALSESNEEQKDAVSYIYTETGERIKIERMKAEEIINCHCGFREEDGLMVQCELCLCWQHALCHNIQRETDVPDKYTCSICLNPRRGRRSQRFLQQQERLLAGRLPGGGADAALRRSHQLSAALLRVADSLHALRVKYYVATKKNHPKLYLWAKDWEDPDVTFAQEKLNAEYSDLSLMINNIGKENLPVKTEDLSNVRLDMQTPTSDNDRLSQREGSLGSHSLLSGLLSSPVGPSLEMPISTSELEKLAKTVQEQEASVAAPQPEAAIENGACRERLLRHLQRCQTLIDARLDTIDADIVELEAQNPSFEDDETADYFPRTKQTIQMLMRDLDTMEELGNVA